jgi:hypothetical protein
MLLLLVFVTGTAVSQPSGALPGGSELTKVKWFSVSVLVCSF